MCRRLPSPLSLSLCLSFVSVYQTRELTHRESISLFPAAFVFLAFEPHVVYISRVRPLSRIYIAHVVIRPASVLIIFSDGFYPSVSDEMMKMQSLMRPLATGPTVKQSARRDRRVIY